MAGGPGLVIIGAQDIGDHIAEAADDAVIVQAGHIRPSADFDALRQADAALGSEQDFGSRRA